MAQAFRTQNLRLLGNLFDKNNSLGAKGYSLYSTGDGTAWKADQNEASGILSGGVLSIGTGNTISVSAGTGQIYTNTVVSSEIVTTVTSVSWNAFTNVSLTYLATKQFTYLYIDQFGALIQSDTVFSDAVFKSSIIIGIVVHLNSSTVNAVINSQNVAYGDAHRLYELYNSFGPMKRSGLSLSASGATLKINRAAGTVLLIGCNYTVDQFEPDISTLTSYTDVKFARVRANGSGGFTFDSNTGSLYTVVDPNNYDNGTGTLASVTAGYWTIQRFYLFPNVADRLVNYYGVATYATLADALLALPNENFSESPFTARDAVFLGYLIVKQGVTDLSNSGNAKFLQAGLSRSLSTPSSAGGSGGSTVTALDDLTDVQITTPLGGQFLTYDSTVSLWKNRSSILDANNNELIKFPSSVASAVNELTISNAATTGSPSISATGDDTNIGLNLISKGTGLVQINGKAISLANSFTTSGNFALTFTTTATTSLTLPTSGTLATTSQIPTVYDNTLTLAGSGGISLSGTPTFTANASADKTITISIADGALAISKLADITTLRILGRTSASTGPVQELDGTGVVAVIGSSAVSRAVNLGGGIAGQIPYQSGANTTLFSAAGTANQVLLSGGTGAPTWANQSSLSVGSATTAGSLANALTISSPLTGTSYNGSSAVSIGLQNATASLSGGVSTSAQTFGGDKTFANNVIVTGDLTVNGTTVTVNTTTLAVKDKNIELGLVTTPTDVTADGGGITLKGATDKTIIWVDSTDAWTLSEHLNIASGKVYRINGTDVLSSTTLGSGIVNSSLTSVGTLTNLTVTNTINGSVSGSAASLSGTYTFWGQSFNGTQNVSGNLTSVGNITGTGGITITAGGSNQNVVLTPSGTGYALLNGSVGIGNSTPNNKLTIQAGDNKDSGPIINLGGNAINQFESGRIRFTEVVTGASPFYEGAYLHYDGSNNLFHIGVHNTNDALIANDTNAISIVRSSANIGIGTTNPLTKLHAIGQVYIDNYTSLTAKNILTLNMNGANYAHIYDTGLAGNIIAIGGSSNVSTVPSASIMSWDLDDARVGIGTNASTAKLHIVTTGTNDGIILDGTSNPIFVYRTSGSDRTYLSTVTSAGAFFTDASQYDFIIRSQANNILFGRGSGTSTMAIVGSNVGVGTVAPAAKLHINSTTSGATLLRADGTNGTLFSVVDDLSDSLMSVNNSAGLPVLEVFADDRIVAGQYGQNDLVVINNKIGVGTANPINKLSVIGAANIGDSTYNVAAPTNGLIVQGDVGIGTASPTAQSNYRFLQVNGTNSAVIETMVGGVRIGGFDSTSSILYVGTIGAFPIVFRTGVNEKWRITNAGIFQSSGAQTIQTDTGNLTLATAAGNGHVVLSPHGTGNVGIGTATPVEKLNVAGNIRLENPYYVYIYGRYASGNNGCLIYQNGTGSNGGFAEIATSTWGLGYWPTAPSAGALTPYIQWSTSTETIKFRTVNADRVIIDNTGNVGIGIASPAAKLDIRQTSAATALKVFTNDTSTAYIAQFIGYDNVLGDTTRMVIQSGGNVGIGTTTPSSKLHISNAAAATRITITDDITNGRSGYIESNYSDALVIGTTSGVRSIKFAPDNSIAMTIQVATNNVGIGTASPSNTLDVNGTARIRSISASGSAATIFLTTDANGVLISRTAAQVRSDIGAGTGNGTVTSVTASTPLAATVGNAPVISLNDAGVTFAKIQNISQGTVIGRSASGTGVSTEIDGAGIASIISTNAVQNATNATNVNITTDDATNSSYYLYFGANASGNTALKASTKIRYNPNTGAFSATTKSFRIPHPTKSEHDLVYGSLESPYHGIRLTGKGKTKGNRAEIILPDYVKVLIDKETINIQLSVIKCAKILYIDDIIIDDNKFTVKYDKSWYEKSKDVEFYWDFTAERKDVPKLIVEEKL